MSQDTLALLKQLSFLQGLPDDLLKRLVARLQEASFAADTPIIKRGQSGDSMYLLVEGEVRIPVSEPDRKHAVQLTKGQIFGEMALLTGAPRSADVVATQDCRCLVFPKEAMDDLMKSHPQVARMLTGILSDRLIRSGKLPSVGKYKLLGEMARGGMAVVYEGFHPELERPVAIKMLHHELVYHPTFGARFRAEARLIAHLRHPHIVEVFDTEEVFATFFIIMEKLKGIDLKSTLEARGKLSYEEARSILRQLASALLFAHRRGVVHRDVKPSNIMLSPEENVKLMDFGIAKAPDELIDDDEVEEQELLVAMGTPHYMSPEQHLGRPVDGRSDIYSLGLVLYTMLSGSLPFDVGKERVGHSTAMKIIHQQKQARGPLSLKEIDPQVPDDLALVVRRATQLSPADRFSSCQEILDLLERSETSGHLLGDFMTSTLSVVYPHGQHEAVSRLLQECKQELRQVEDILII